jgi:hypothetical protein
MSAWYETSIVAFQPISDNLPYSLAQLIVLSFDDFVQSG